MPGWRREAGMRTRRTDAGIVYEVLNSNGQIMWRKLVTWHRSRHNKYAFKAAALEQERIAMERRM